MVLSLPLLLALPLARQPAGLLPLLAQRRQRQLPSLSPGDAARPPATPAVAAAVPAEKASTAADASEVDVGRRTAVASAAWMAAELAVKLIKDLPSEASDTLARLNPSR